MNKEKYVFLDRDGVINKDGDGWTKYGYITSVKDFYFLPGVTGALSKLASRGYKAVIISNQQGVARKIYSDNDLGAITEFFVKKVNEAGGNIAKVYYCTHLKEEDCACRKPKSGLFLKAKKELGIRDLGGFFYIGDRERDIEAGKGAGLKTIAVLTGLSSRAEIRAWGNKPDYISGDLEEAAEIVLKESK